jgi:hypothetical protein
VAMSGNWSATSGTSPENWSDTVGGDVGDWSAAMSGTGRRTGRWRVRELVGGDVGGLVGGDWSVQVATLADWSACQRDW